MSIMRPKTFDLEQQLVEAAANRAVKRSLSEVKDHHDTLSGHGYLLTDVEREALREAISRVQIGLRQIYERMAIRTLADQIDTIANTVIRQMETK